MAPSHRDVVSGHTANVSLRIVASLAILWIGAGPLAAQFKSKLPSSATPDDQPGSGPESNVVKSGLPPGFNPPGEPHPSMSIHVELITPEEIEKFRKDGAGDWSQYMFEGSSTGAKGEVVKRGIEVYVKALTLLSDPAELEDARVKLKRGLAAAVPGQTNLKAQRFREFVMEEVTKHASELLDNYLHVRLQAVYILSELTIKPADFRTGAPAVPYAGAAVPLLEVIENTDQPLVVKIAAVNGLTRILKLGELNTQDRQRIADVLIAQLDDTSQFYWYQRAVVAALGWAGAVVDGAGLPTVVQKLSQVMFDEQRRWQVRAQAARSLGRASLNSQVRVDLLAYGVAHLCNEMAKAHNENPQAAYWGECFWNVYFAFRHGRNEEPRQAGLINKLTSAGFGQYRPTVIGAYEQVFPVIQSLVNNGITSQISDDVLKPLQDWLTENAPPDFRVHPNLDPISLLNASSPEVDEADADSDAAADLVGR